MCCRLVHAGIARIDPAYICQIETIDTLFRRQKLFTGVHHNGYSNTKKLKCFYQGWFIDLRLPVLLCVQEAAVNADVIHAAGEQILQKNMETDRFILPPPGNLSEEGTI